MIQGDQCLPGLCGQVYRTPASVDDRFPATARKVGIVPCMAGIG